MKKIVIIAAASLVSSVTMSAFADVDTVRMGTEQWTCCQAGGWDTSLWVRLHDGTTSCSTIQGARGVTPAKDCTLKGDTYRGGSPWPQSLLQDAVNYKQISQSFKDLVYGVAPGGSQTVTIGTDNVNPNNTWNCCIKPGSSMSTSRWVGVAEGNSCEAAGYVQANNCTLETKTFVGGQLLQEALNFNQINNNFINLFNKSSE